MNLSLSTGLQKWINDRVQSGQYATPEDVVAAALLSLDQQERMSDFTAGELDELLGEGERSIEQGGTLDGEEAHRQRRERRGKAQGRS